MAQQDKRGENPADQLADESTQLKKRARRRLIGAAALALLAAIVLPMVMDHQPAPPIRDIQVRIPSPDEGAKQRPQAGSVAVRKEEKPAEPAAPDVAAAAPAKAERKTEPKVEPKVELRPAVEKPAAEKNAAQETVRAQEAIEGKGTAAEAWEVQLGAYQEAGRVKLLVGKLKDLGVPTYTEKVDTPNGPRTRVRAGPFPSQEAAEKARARIKIVGVDGPVAKKP
jgi:DedD protein